MDFKYITILFAVVLMVHDVTSTLRRTRYVPRTISEVHVSRGTPGASSTLGGSWAPKYGFVPNYYYGWRTKPKYGNAPAMIWYQFRERFVPAEVTFRPSCYKHEAPTKYQFVGTNDRRCNEYSPWTILCEDLSGKRTLSLYETKRCVVSEKITTSFECFGIRSLGTANSNAYVSLTNMRFWKRIAMRY